MTVVYWLRCWNFRGFGPSVGAPSSCRGLKAIYFELKIMSEFRGAGLAVGIAGTNFPSYYNLVREWSSCFAHLNTSVSWLARCSNQKLNGSIFCFAPCLDGWSVKVVWFHANYAFVWFDIFEPGDMTINSNQRLIGRKVIFSVWPAMLRMELCRYLWMGVPS